MIFLPRGKQKGEGRLKAGGIWHLACWTKFTKVTKMRKLYVKNLMCLVPVLMENVLRNGSLHCIC
jgi:hypothetical protein